MIAYVPGEESSNEVFTMQRLSVEKVHNELSLGKPEKPCYDT